MALTVQRTAACAPMPSRPLSRTREALFGGTPWHGSIDGPFNHYGAMEAKMIRLPDLFEFQVDLLEAPSVGELVPQASSAQ